MLPLTKKPLWKGESLIGVLISLAIFIILSHALLTLVTTIYSLNTYNRSRITARHLAQEKMEIIRNMPYEDIGTIGGIPPGNLPQTEILTINGLRYDISTTIVYIDDEFDDTAPEDLLATDYKRVSVEISWEGMDSSGKNPLKMLTDISPSGIETTDSGGTLSVYVFDANALPVPQADVSIISTDTVPLVNMSIKTNIDGRVILPGAPVCRKACYQISVSKDGYSSERTYSTTEVDNPAKPYLSVLEGKITESSFSIDKVGTINITSHKGKENAFEVFPNIPFTISGEKIIGTDSDDNPVYKYQEDFTTDVSGVKILEDMEWDNYQISISSIVGDISAQNPPPPVALDPDENLDVDIGISSDSENSVLVTFIDQTGYQIASISARLYDSGGYESATMSGITDQPDFGQVFFRDLSRKIYSLSATISGYIDYNGNVDSYGYKQLKIILNPI